MVETEIQKVKDSICEETLSKLLLRKDEMIKMSGQERIDTYRNNVFDLLEKILKEIQDNLSQVYVSCFSKAKDLLSQWRGYGDDGYGIAIGFNANKLNSLAQYKIELRQILYFEDHQSRILTNGLSEYALGLIDSKDWFYHNILPVMKPQGFSEEQEFRLVVIPRNSTLDTGYYFKGGRLHDYYKLPVLEDYISEIVLGPKCEIEKKDLVTFFNSCGTTINEDQIISSKLSYR